MNGLQPGLGDSVSEFYLVELLRVSIFGKKKKKRKGKKRKEKKRKRPIIVTTLGVL